MKKKSFRIVKFQALPFCLLLGGVVGVAAGIGCSPRGTPLPVLTGGIAPAQSNAQSLQTEISLTGEIARRTPNFANWTYHGLAQLKAKDLAAAVKAFEAALKFEPRSAVGLNNMCVAYNELKYWRRAIEACEGALATDPNYQLAKNNLAFATANKKSASDKIGQLETKARASDVAPEIHIDLGMAYFSEGEFSKAITAWKRVPREAKLWGMAQNNVGSAAIMEKNFSVAEEALNQALSVEPSNPLFLNNMNWLSRARKEASHSE